MSHVRSTILTMAWVLSSFALAPAQARETRVLTSPVDAVWRLQTIAFNYRSMHVYYSCDGMRHKVAGILKAIGARPDVRVAIECRTGDVMNDMQTVITVATPVEATPEMVEALTTYSPEIQLAARLRSIRLPRANDIEHLSAEWRTVEVDRITRLNLGAGDCDLLEGLADQVFPRLAITVVKRRVSCSPSSIGRMRPTLHVAALIAAPVEPVAYAPNN